MWILLRSTSLHRVVTTALALGMVLALVPAAHSAPTASARPAAFRYLSPVPGAQYVRPEAGLIVRLERRPAGALDLQAALRVVGSASGVHAGVARFARDGRTLLFQPRHAFAWGEEVSVELFPALSSSAGGAALAYTYSFHIAQTPPPPYTPVPEWMEAMPAGTSAATGSRRPPVLAGLPDDFPEIISTVYQTPAPGILYLANVRFGGPPSTPYLMKLDDQAVPAYYREMPSSCFDYKLQPNGLATYFDQSTDWFYAMNASGTVVDSFHCGNGHTTDLHELRIGPDGHAYLMSYDEQSVDMSQVVPGGNPSAVVVGLVIQELDLDKNVVFEWRSWDHYQITDAVGVNLTAPQVDYAHGNAIEIEDDNTLMISCRHMDEITKISRETGDMVWRWGGKNNQFEFVGDTVHFSHQHAIRRTTTGTLTMYDNGNDRDPPYSRAVEYDLDEVNFKAQAVWEYRNTPDVFGGAMGYVQRLTNGNTLISWGTGKPDITEVTPTGEKTVEMTLPPGVFTYRAYRFDTNTVSVGGAAPTSRLQLAAAAPNPSRGRASLGLTLPSSATVSFAVFDLAGRQVAEPLRGARLEPGVHRLDVDLAGKPAGLYFCRVDADGVQETRKLLLTR